MPYILQTQALKSASFKVQLRKYSSSQINPSTPNFKDVGIGEDVQNKLVLFYVANQHLIGVLALLSPLSRLASCLADDLGCLLKLSRNTSCALVNSKRKKMWGNTRGCASPHAASAGRHKAALASARYRHKKQQKEWAEHNTTHARNIVPDDDESSSDRSEHLSRPTPRMHRKLAQEDYDASKKGRKGRQVSPPIFEHRVAHDAADASTASKGGLPWLRMHV
ncbi:hypothetical protein K438DRAFT_1779048 [Mycena galopus ATCC 62051]|nr:hypothetical protein K438DRAFT_1779048 [Mycena galopus ATCC 62051]